MTKKHSAMCNLREEFTAVTEMLIENQVISEAAGLVNAPLGSDDGFVSHTVSSIQHSFIKH